VARRLQTVRPATDCSFQSSERGRLTPPGAPGLRVAGIADTPPFPPSSNAIDVLTLLDKLENQGAYLGRTAPEAIV
jgi:hypothetical protein